MTAAVAQAPLPVPMVAVAAAPEAVVQIATTAASRFGDAVRAVIAYGIFGFGVLFPFALLAYIKFFHG